MTFLLLDLLAGPGGLGAPGGKGPAEGQNGLATTHSPADRCQRKRQHHGCDLESERQGVVGAGRGGLGASGGHELSCVRLGPSSSCVNTAK